MNRVDGRILEYQHARRKGDVRLDQLDDGASPGDEDLPIAQPTLDVLEAADGVEVVRLVVVERRLPAQRAVRRGRSGVDLDSVRIVVDVARARAHEAPPRLI